MKRPLCLALLLIFCSVTRAQTTPEALLYQTKVYRELYRTFLSVEIEKYERKKADPRHPYPAKLHYFLGRCYLERGVFDTRNSDSRNEHLNKARASFADFQRAATPEDETQGWKTLAEIESLVCDYFLGNSAATQKLQDLAKNDQPPLVLSQLGRRLIELGEADGVAICEKAQKASVGKKFHQVCENHLAYARFAHDPSRFAEFDSKIPSVPFVEEAFSTTVKKDGESTVRRVPWKFWDASMFRDKAAVNLAHFQQVARENQLYPLAEHASEAVEFESGSLLIRTIQNRSQAQPIWECYQKLLETEIPPDEMQTLESKVKEVSNLQARVYLLSELGLKYLRQNNGQKAKAACQLAITTLGDAAQKQGKQMHLATRIKLNPVYRAHAVVLAELGEYDEAEKTFRLTFSSKDKLNPTYRYHDPVYLIRYSRTTIALKKDDFGLALNTFGPSFINRYPEAQALRDSIVDLKWLVERGAKKTQ